MAYPYDDAPDAPPIPLRAERDFGDVVNVTFRLITDHFRQLMPALLVVLGVPLLISFALSLFSGQIDYMTQWIETMQGGTPQALDDLFTPRYFALMGVGSLFAMILGFLATTAGYAYVVLYREGQAPTLTPGLLWEAMKPLMGPVAGVIGFLILGYIVFIIAAVLISLIPIVGVIAAVVFGTWTLPILFLLTPARIFDADNVFEAWKRAVGLVKGSWWRALGLMIVIGFILIAISMVFSIPSWIAMGMIASDASAAGRIVLGISGLFSHVAAPLFYVVPPIASSVLYLTLLAEVEGPELYDRIEAIGVDEDDEEPLF